MLGPLLGAMCATALAGTPWIHERGASYAKLSEQRFATTGFVAPDGTRQDSSQYIGWMSAVYAEAGLGRGVQVMASVPYVHSRTEVAGAAFVNRGLGDANVGVSWGTTLGLPVALTLRSKLPLYDNAHLGVFGPAGGRFPALGDGQVDVDALVSVGTGIAAGSVRGWWLADVGLRHRTEWWLGDSAQPDRSLGDGVVVRSQLGWTPTLRGRDFGWVFMESTLVKAFETDLVTRQSWDLAGGVAMRVGTSGWALEVGGSGAMWVEATAPGWAASVGVSRQSSGRRAQAASGG